MAYLCGGAGVTDRVWYASYGSNLNSDRFLCYILGGTPTGSKHRNPGSRDRTPPLDSRPLTLNFELYFAGNIRAWGDGGVAFIRRGETTARTLGRMYLITEEQFNDVVLQENGKPVDGTRILPQFPELVRNERTILTESGLYGDLLLLEDGPDGAIFSFTTHRHDLRPNAPSEAYVKVIAAGIKETYPGMANEEICRYLLLADGVRDRIAPDLLEGWVAET